MRIKVCGITRPEDARRAQALGVDYLGLIFARCSPRRVTERTARSIAACVDRARLVGVFVEQDETTMIRLSRELGLDAVQIYRTPTRRLPGVRVIQAVPVGPDLPPSALHVDRADHLLVDSHHPTRPGGTGTTFDWSVLPADLDQVFLAGGIHRGNLPHAKALQPFAIDVCTGVERSPGIKDAARLEQFVAEARS